MRIHAAGGLNLDILGTPHKEMLLRDSNPGSVCFRLGGVAHNIALAFRRMGHESRLFSVAGEDTVSLMILRLLEQEGFSKTDIINVPTSSSVYLCVHDAAGDMLAAVNDMDALTYFSVQEAGKILQDFSRADACVLETNLPEATLLYLAENISVPLFLDTVSVAKAEKALKVLPYLTAIKPNFSEAKRLTGMNRPAEMARALMMRGVQNVFISLGSEGVFYMDRQDAGLVPAPSVPQGTPLTGAGDYLCAGLLEGLLGGEKAQNCAAHAVHSVSQWLLGQ